MDSDIKQSWLSMSERRLYEHLKQAGFSQADARSKVDRVLRIKKKLKAERISATVGKQRWLEVLSPARIELSGVRTMKSQLKSAVEKGIGSLEDDARYAALCAYELVLVKIIERLRKVQLAGEHTPLQLAEALREAGKMPTDGDGTHWTDYVTAADRRKVERMFNELPDPRRGKRKVPFVRKLSVTEHRRLKHALWDRMVDEKLRAEQELDLAQTEAHRKELEDKVMKLEHAIFKLSELPSTALVPRTWRELFDVEDPSK